VAIRALVGCPSRPSRAAGREVERCGCQPRRLRAADAAASALPGRDGEAV